MIKSNVVMAIEKRLSGRRLFYVARDLERAIGINKLKNYFIITNDTPYAKKMAKNRPDIIVIKNKIPLDTLGLLQHKITSSLIKNSDYVLVFKNTRLIESFCAENKWTLLNPSADLANIVEEKISQIKWLGPLKKYLPDYKVQLCKNIKWPGHKFVLQFNRSHTGSGTVLVEIKQKLEEIKKKFPEREARIAKYIDGPLFTNNNVVAKDTVLLGNINYQITGLLPFTDNPFTTIGNDWELPRKILNKKQLAQYKKIATDVGNRLRDYGWKGLFGIDVVLEQKTGKLYLLEIDCRQPASTTYESQLQQNTQEETRIMTK